MKTLVAITGALLLTAGAASAQECGGPDRGRAAVLEIVEFQLMPGVSPEDFRARTSATMPFLCGRDGFLRRTMGLTAEGRWVDVVEWSSLDAALAAAGAAMQAEAVQPFLSAIDMNSAKMQHAVVGSAN